MCLPQNVRKGCTACTYKTINDHKFLTRHFHRHCKEFKFRKVSTKSLHRDRKILPLKHTRISYVCFVLYYIYTHRATHLGISIITISLFEIRFLTLLRYLQYTYRVPVATYNILLTVYQRFVPIFSSG